LYINTSLARPYTLREFHTALITINQSINQLYSIKSNLIYLHDRELESEYIINIGRGFVQVSEVLVVCFIKQNLVLGFVGQNLARGFMEYISIVVSLSAKSSVMGSPKVIGCSLVVE
jgi:hypothetical protein